MIASPIFFAEGMALGFGCVCTIKQRYPIEVGWSFAYGASLDELYSESSFWGDYDDSDLTVPSIVEHSYKFPALVADTHDILTDVYIEYGSSAEFLYYEHGAAVRNDVM